jgi:hypothetical protein
VGQAAVNPCLSFPIEALHRLVHKAQDVPVRMLEPHSPRLTHDMDVAFAGRVRKVVLLEERD